MPPENPAQYPALSRCGGVTNSGGLGVNTPSDSPRSGQGRSYVLKPSLRSGISLASRPSRAPAPFDETPPACAWERSSIVRGHGSFGASDEGLGVAGGEADARDSARRPPPADAALLSMGHNPSPSNPHPPVVRLWTEGTRADCPSIPNLRPGTGKVLRPGNDSKRGKVTEFTAKSRRNLVRKLGTLKTSAKCFTMALTLPGQLEHLTREQILEAFAKLERRYTARARFASVPIVWKREIQKRGAVHWHFLIYCPLDGYEGAALMDEVHQWFVRQWNSLVCAGASEKTREEHRWWHARAENFEPVKDMAGYFAKYLGKDEDASGALPGRWWGSWNKGALPESPCEATFVPLRVAVDVHRAFRKIRQKRANEGKQKAIAARLWNKGMGKSWFDLSRPLSLWDLERLRMGYTPEGRNPRWARFLLACSVNSAKGSGLRWGKFRFNGDGANTASIVLVGKDAPNIGLRLLGWSAERHGIELRLGDYEPPAPPPPVQPPPGYVKPKIHRKPRQLDLLEVSPSISTLSRASRLSKMGPAYAGASS